ncbi:MAG: chloride channel protein [Candidatus Thermoplasmatota archaeon]|nr:chloride channel protein [Candidatus Thermoplasmatota archaeon]
MRSIGSRLKRMSRTFSPDYMFFNVIAAVVGILAAFAAIALFYLIDFFREVFLVEGGYGTLDNPFPLLIPLVLLAPAVGGLLVGLLVRFAAREAKGHGVPEVMESVAVRGGKIRPRVVWVKGLATALTIGSGGSTGREGPIVLMGSGIGSWIGQKLKLTPYQTKVLVSCGAAGGISATFNTPIAAVFFPIELILGEFKTRSFIPIVISSVFSNIARRSILGILGSGEDYVFGAAGGTIPRVFELESIWEYGLYILLGVLSALVAIMFIRTLYSLENLFERMRIPSFVKPAIGGLLVGTLGLVLLFVTGESTYIMGIGYDHLNDFMDGAWGETYSIWALFLLLSALVLTKMLATSVTLGSGGSGGVFAPSLFLGAVLGGAFGLLADQLMPFDVGPAYCYALVGMSAVFAGASRAAITAMIIIFEMTGTYEIILPLMLATVVSDGIGAFLFRDSIYTMQLRFKGVKVSPSMAADVLDVRSAGWTMDDAPFKVGDNMGIDEFERLISSSEQNCFPVIDGHERLVGLIGRDMLRVPGKKGETVGDRMRTDIRTVYPGESLKLAVSLLSESGQSLIPVVDPSDRGKLLGTITEKDVVSAYRRNLEEFRESNGLPGALFRLFRRGERK